MHCSSADCQVPYAVEKDTVFILLLTLNSSLVNMMDFGIFSELPNSPCEIHRDHKYITDNLYFYYCF